MSQETGRMVSITTSDMENQPHQLIPDSIIEYRRLKKQDLVQKIVEAREELAIYKKVPIDIAEVKATANKKEVFGLATELFILRNSILTCKELEAIKPPQELINAKEADRAIAKANPETKEPKRRGRPSKKA